jgi:hypothetical protein
MFCSAVFFLRYKETVIINEKILNKKLTLIIIDIMDIITENFS